MFGRFITDNAKSNCDVYATIDQVGPGRGRRIDQAKSATDFEKQTNKQRNSFVAPSANAESDSWTGKAIPINPFTPKNDSPAASPEIQHHIVWRTSGF